FKFLRQRGAAVLFLVATGTGLTPIVGDVPFTAARYGHIPSQPVRSDEFHDLNLFQTSNCSRVTGQTHSRTGPGIFSDIEDFSPYQTAHDSIETLERRL